MAKLLKNIIGSKNSSTKKVNDLGGYSPKAGDEQEFAKKHEIQKWDDRNGNGDDVFNAAKIKHSQVNEPRHGYKKPEDLKVNEDWIVTHSDGRVTKHLGQRDAMKASRSSPGSNVSATHGAMGQKASAVLAPHQRGDIGTFSAAGYTPPEKKKKMREELDLEENKLYHVSWGGNREHQVVAKHGEEAVSKAKDAIIKKMPKFQDQKYADAFDRKPTVTNLSHERKVQKDRVQEEIEEIDELSKNTLGSYATKAHRQGDMAARMSNGGQKKDMAAIANKRYQGVQTAIKKMREELDEISIVGRSKVDNFAFSKKGKEFRAAHIAKQKAQYDPVMKKQKEIKSKNLEMLKAVSAKRKAANEEVEIEEAMTLKQKAFSNRTKNHPGRKGGVFDTKSNFDAPDHKVHVVVSKGDKKETIKDVVQARDKNEAIFKTQMKYHKMGYKVHDTMHKGIVKEDLAIPLLGGGDEDESAEMLKTQLKAIANKAMHLVTQLSDDQLIEPWVQSKIAVAKDQVTAVHDYMIYGDHDTEKEQTGPDTPMTFPGMNVDVNSGVNV